MWLAHSRLPWLISGTLWGGDRSWGGPSRKEGRGQQHGGARNLGGCKRGHMGAAGGVSPESDIQVRGTVTSAAASSARGNSWKEKGVTLQHCPHPAVSGVVHSQVSHRQTWQFRHAHAHTVTTVLCMHNGTDTRCARPGSCVKRKGSQGIIEWWGTWNLPGEPCPAPARWSWGGRKGRSYFPLAPRTACRLM